MSDETTQNDGSVEAVAEHLRGLAEAKVKSSDGAPEGDGSQDHGRQADDAGPAEGRPTSDDTTEDEPGPEDRLIAPPVSWSADEKELFDSLSPEVKRVVAARESERDESFRARTRELAEKAKASESELTQAKQERQRYAAALQSHGTALEQSFKEQGFDKLSPESIVEMSNPKSPKYDPAKAAAYAAHVTALNAVNSQAHELRQKAENDFFTDVRARQAKTHEELVKEMPDWFGTPEKANKSYERITKYLTEQGFDPREISVIHDKRIIQMVRESFLYREAQRAKEKAEKAAAKPVVKVMKSGTGGVETADSERVVALEKRAKATGHPDDVAAWMRAKDSTRGRERRANR